MLMLVDHLPSIKLRDDEHQKAQPLDIQVTRKNVYNERE